MSTTQDVATAAPRVAPRLTVRHRIALLVAVLAAIAGTLGLTVVPHLPGPTSALQLPWIAWVAAFARLGYRIAADRVSAEIGKGGDKLVPSILGRAADTGGRRSGRALLAGS